MNFKITIIVSLFSLGGLLTSCSTNDETYEKETQSTHESVTLKPKDAQIKFAEILSKAVYNSQSLRKFLKEEAVEQFDNDYDIFYPLVKDKIVENGKSFKEILRFYSENQNDIDNIEETLPLLNILIPDLSSYTNINAENLDITDNELPVCVSNAGQKSVLFVGGDSIAKLDLQEVPAFHILVVKNNERVTLGNSTALRSTNTMGKYQFIDDVYDKTKNKPITNDLRSSTDAFPQTDYLMSHQIDPKVRDAWKYFQGTPYQRDYIYYGLTPTKKEGKLDIAMEECLYRFMINPNIYYRIADQTEDPRIKKEDTSNEKSELPREEIIRRLWTEGSFEITIDVFTGSKGAKEVSTLDKQRLRYPAKPDQLFDIQISKSKRHKTMFRRTKYTYWIEADNLGTKWFYPAQFSLPSRIDKWNLETQSLERYVSIFEHDEQEKITEKVESSTTYTHNFKWSGEGSYSGIKTSLGYELTVSSVKKSSTEIVKDKGDDDLGTLKLYFFDSVITNVDGDKYLPKSVSNGTVIVTMLPISEKSILKF